ncbi:hypothetical protein AAZX31_14G173400 [Glycine max]|uniref:protein RESPONSE TO LOW SULFUR 3 n=1 Tax=Glycine max TaxID=3847 RepID=UPI001B3553CD|nr:protein RESPONSE TO LOW SULFUR 3 [Glycine max]KAG4963820.1 hypothetical protein JHK86_040688 [Glycine max]KAG4966307.1 hypothetical protein JHK85_041282 [Glycine max]KAG5111273.1 hypothetical protein JHK82_040496 [Glycine max]KAG5122559.1 hypothetical protein JHK84_040899 [Glycine max]KAH1095234.1 hypothetical protein GYH30_040499 [Glycine max]
MIMGIGDKKKKTNTRECETTSSLELQLKKRNEELEEELSQSKEREEHVRRQLRAALDRLTVAEEAEERLCAQLGDLEAEALQQAREYHARIVSLVDQLSQAHSLLLNTPIPLHSRS